MFSLIDFIIVRPIVNILFLIYNLVGDFGLAIIIFVIIVKFLMWPLVKRQLHQTKLMRKIQPELAEIKKSCNGNRQMESLQMMDLYKRNNIKPFRSVLITFIQLPVFFALFMAVSAIANPHPSGDTCGYTNVSNCAYAPVRSLSRIDEIIDLQDSYLADTANNSYNFQPKLFGLVDLSVRPSDLLSGKISKSVIFIFLVAVAAAFMQYFVSRQQLPTGKAEKSKSFRELMKEAESGKEPDQAELNAIAQKQMGFMMPLMMFFIMFYLPGALVLYYLLSSLVTLAQQRIILRQTNEEMEVSADKAVLKELRKIKEAEVIENKKTGTKITRISAKDNKKKRR